MSTVLFFNAAATTEIYALSLLDALPISYSYTVTDSKSCTATTTGDITQPPTLVPNSSNTEIFCHGGMSTVTVSATGGTAPYSGTGTFSVPAGTYRSEERRVGKGCRTRRWPNH